MHKLLYCTTYLRRIPFSSAGLFHDTFKWWEPFSMTSKFLTALGPVYNKYSQTDTFTRQTRDGTVHQLITTTITTRQS